MSSQHHDAANHPSTRQTSRSRWVLLGFLAVAAYFLWTEHKAHLAGFLPYLLLLACPLMHLFHHHGHGQDTQQKNAPPPNRQGEP